MKEEESLGHWGMWGGIVLPVPTAGKIDTRHTCFESTNCIDVTCE